MATEKQPKLSKRVKAVRSKVDRAKAYSVDEALKLVKTFATAKFNETVDCSVNLGIAPTALLVMELPRVPDARQHQPMADASNGVAVLCQPGDSPDRTRNKQEPIRVM